MSTDGPTSGQGHESARPHLTQAVRERVGEAAKRPVRRVLDGLSARIVAGLAPRLEAHAPEGAQQGGGPPAPRFFDDAHNLMHALRTVELARMPAGAQVLVSAGASGRWYFDWIDTEYGRVRRHIGVEKYLPKPDDLPDNAEWVAASVADMPDVADGSVDLLFSGQNVEHLFGDDLVGFLVEAARVVRPGGHIVIDSPNREVASLLVWSMSEHTVELTPEEARELVTLAGFDVTSLRGVWLCRDARTGEVMPYDPFAGGSSPLEIVRRIALGPRLPEDCAVYWLEARRSDRAPDREAMRRRHAEIFRTAWPERQQRFLTIVGTVRVEDGVRTVGAPADAVGCLMHGPYMPLAAGDYRVTMTVRRLTSGLAPGAVVSRLDVVAEGEEPTLAVRELCAADLPVGEWTRFEIPFHVDTLRWGGQFRVYGVGVCAIEARMHVDLDDAGSAVYPSTLRAAPAAAGGA